MSWALAAALGMSALTSLMAKDRAGDAYDRQRYEQGQFLKRKFAADTENYNVAMRTYKKNLNYLNSLIVNPTIHPDYTSMKSGLEKEFKSSRERLKDTLRKRGRTGGVQDKVLTDLQSVFEGNLATIQDRITGAARQQKLGLQQPPKPYLGMPSVEWQKFFKPTEADPVADLAGLGMLLALNQQKTTTPGKEIDKSTLTNPTSLGLRDIQQWKDLSWKDWGMT